MFKTIATTPDVCEGNRIPVEDHVGELSSSEILASKDAYRSDLMERVVDLYLERQYPDRTKSTLG